MKTLQVKLSEADFRKYNFKSNQINFNELIDIISREYARKALWECNEIAAESGLSQMTMEEINEEVKAFRDAKNHS